MLLANVALPFFALARHGPLVAVWFARRYPRASPYPLYAVSNLGSLVALLSYPFAIEPRLPLSTTGGLWSGAFVATGAAVIACGALAVAARHATSPTLGRRSATDRTLARADRALGAALGVRGRAADGRHQPSVPRRREHSRSSGSCRSRSTSRR
jgi:hypothetical protein